jgi:hypothetical protein
LLADANYFRNVFGSPETCLFAECVEAIRSKICVRQLTDVAAPPGDEETTSISVSVRRPSAWLHAFPLSGAEAQKNNLMERRECADALKLILNKTEAQPHPGSCNAKSLNQVCPGGRAPS